MSKEKKYIGNLNIGKKNISIDADINYQAIEIKYAGTMNVSSLLTNNYILQKGSNKIIIVKMIKDDNILNDLFSYRGMAIITHCVLVDLDLNKYNLYINKHSLQIWDSLKKASGSSENMDWNYLGDNWEDIDFDGNNNKRKYLHKKTTFDKATKTYTTTREIRKK